MVTELKDKMQKSPDFIVTNFMGSSNSDIEQLRKNLDKISSRYFVTKNSVAKVVLQKMKLDDASSMIDGGVGISFSGKDLIGTCKALAAFAKDHNKFMIKGGYIDGKLVTADKVKTIATLPSKEVLLAQVVGGMKAPINGFVNTLSGVLRKFVYVVDAIKKSKEKV